MSNELTFSRANHYPEVEELSFLIVCWHTYIKTSTAISERWLAFTTIEKCCVFKSQGEAHATILPLKTVKIIDGEFIIHDYLIFGNFGTDYRVLLPLPATNFAPLNLLFTIDVLPTKITREDAIASPSLLQLVLFWYLFNFLTYGLHRSVKWYQVRLP